MKRIIVLVLLLMLAVTGLASAQDEPVLLTFFTTEADPSQLQALAGIIDEYHAMNPNVFVDVVTGTPSTRGDRLKTLLAAGADAGIFEVEPAFANSWAEAGYLLPLDDIYEENGGEENYVPGSVFFSNDTAYALPYATSVYGMWIRTDLFEAAGITPPTNYDELLAAAEALTNEDEGVYGLAFAGATNASVSFFSTFLWNNCLDYYTPEGELLFGQPAYLEAINKWVALSKYAPPGFEGWSFGDQITAFMTGQTAMSMYAGRLGSRMPDQAPHLESISSLIQLPYSYTEGSPYVTYGSWSRIGISANSENPEEAKDFLQFFLSGDRLARYDATVLGHMVPPLKDVADMLVTWDSDYARNHSDWIQFFNENAQYTNHQSNNMGSVVGCEFNKNNTPPAWGGPIFSSGGIIDLMLQDIYFGGDAEAAWMNAVAEMERVQAEWMADNS